MIETAGGTPPATAAITCYKQMQAARDVSSDERILAALAHGSVILFGWGVIAAVLLWVTQRHKSAFVRFHALQALAYQLLQTVFWIAWVSVLFLLAFCVSLGLGVFAANGSARVAPGMLIATQFLIFGGFFCGFALYALVGIAGAVFLLLGRDFNYPLIGARIRRYVSEPADMSA